MSTPLCKLDVVRVWLKYPNSPSADPLHRSDFVGGLGQTWDLGGRSSRAVGRSSKLYTCNQLTITSACFCYVAPFKSKWILDTNVSELSWKLILSHCFWVSCVGLCLSIFSFKYSNVLQVMEPENALNFFGNACKHFMSFIFNFSYLQAWSFDGWVQQYSSQLKT